MEKTELLGVTDAAKVIGWQPQMVSKYAARGSFPDPIKTTTSGPKWQRKQIQQFKDTLEKRKDLIEANKDGDIQKIKTIVTYFIRWCQKEIGRVPSSIDYRKWTETNHAPDYTTLLRYMNDIVGTWEQLLRSLGMTLQSKQVGYTRERCLNALRACSNFYQSNRFTFRAYNQWAREHGEPSSGYMQQEFGSFNAAKEAVGFPINIQRGKRRDTDVG